jgi:hypothetical protein
MSCDCIEKIEAAIRKDTGDPEARFKVGFRFIKEKAIKPLIYIPIEVSYRKRKKDGTFGRIKEMDMIGTFCPFCGKKIGEKS